jgi:hypothetical protein
MHSVFDLHCRSEINVSDGRVREGIGQCCRYTLCPLGRRNRASSLLMTTPIVSLCLRARLMTTRD